MTGCESTPWVVAGLEALRTSHCQATEAGIPAHPATRGRRNCAEMRAAHQSYPKRITPSRGQQRKSRTRRGRCPVDSCPALRALKPGKDLPSTQKTENRGAAPVCTHRRCSQPKLLSGSSIGRCEAPCAVVAAISTFRNHSAASVCTRRRCRQPWLLSVTSGGRCEAPCAVAAAASKTENRGAAPVCTRRRCSPP